MTDLLLSVFHFLLVFSLVAILAAQSLLVRPGITTTSLRLAANLDRAYGASAVLLLGVGFSRVYWGGKGLILLSVESPLLDQDWSLYDRGIPLDSADRAADSME